MLDKLSEALTVVELYLVNALERYMAAVSTSCKANCKPRGRIWGFRKAELHPPTHTLAEVASNVPACCTYLHSQEPAQALHVLEYSVIVMEISKLWPPIPHASLTQFPSPLLGLGRDLSGLDGDMDVRIQPWPLLRWQLPGREPQLG